MRTSNTILIVFFVVVMIVPIITTQAFKNEVRKGRYTLVANDVDRLEEKPTRQFHPYKYVRISAPTEFLDCKISYADKVSFKSHMFNDSDSIRMVNVADTLVVEYVAANKDAGRGRSTIYLSLPDASNLLIENAAVTIMQSDEFREKSYEATLLGNASFELGGDRTDFQPQSTIVYTDSTKPIAAVSVATQTGTVSINQPVKELKLDLGRGAILNLNNTSIWNITGAVDSNVLITGHWQTIQKLQLNRK